MLEYLEAHNFNRQALEQLLRSESDTSSDVAERRDLSSTQIRQVLSQQLMRAFRGSAPFEDAFSFTYYSEIALLIREVEPHGARLLYAERDTVGTQQLRAMLFALAEPPKLRRPWLPQLWVSYLDDERPEIVAEAIDGLWRYGDKKARFQVMQLQQHHSEYVRGSVLRYISHIMPHFAPLLLVSALRDGHFIVRETAIDEIDRLEAVESLPYLYPLIEDASSQVRQAAITATANLKLASDYDHPEELRAG